MALNVLVEIVERRKKGIEKENHKENLYHHLYSNINIKFSLLLDVCFTIFLSPFGFVGKIIYDKKKES